MSLFDVRDIACMISENSSGPSRYDRTTCIVLHRWLRQPHRFACIHFANLCQTANIDFRCSLYCRRLFIFRHVRLLRLIYIHIYYEIILLIIFKKINTYEYLLDLPYIASCQMLSELSARPLLTLRAELYKF